MNIDNSLIVNILTAISKMAGFFLLLLVTFLIGWTPVFMKVNVLIWFSLKEKCWDPVRFSAKKPPPPKIKWMSLIMHEWSCLSMFHLIFRTSVHFFSCVAISDRGGGYVALLSISDHNRNSYKFCSLLLTLSQTKLKKNSPVYTFICQCRV